jgi:hypothetical protein
MLNKMCAHMLNRRTKEFSFTGALALSATADLWHPPVKLQRLVQRR